LAIKYKDFLDLFASGSAGYMAYARFKAS